MMDYAARYREQDSDHSWSIAAEANEWEAAERIANEGGCDPRPTTCWKSEMPVPALAA
jgi:hypothetical protein